MTDTPAGWYPNPENAAELRYWDGQAWTDSTSPVQPPAQPPYPSYPAYPTDPSGQGFSGPMYGAQPGGPNPSNTLSIIGIVVGAISLLFCPILFGPAGLVLGGIAMSKKERLAKVALIVSGVCMIGGFIISAVVYNSMDLSQ